MAYPISSDETRYFEVTMNESETIVDTSFSDSSEYYAGNLSYEGSDSTNYDTCEFVPGTIGMKVFMGVTFSLVFFICGLGDSILCYLVLTQQRLRTVTNLLIANLAASDALVAILCVPFSLIYYEKREWIWGSFMCQFVGTVKDVSFYVSINTLLVIAVDRYYGIFHPFRPRMQKATLAMIIVSIWIVSALLSIPNSISLKLITGECYGEHVFACIARWDNVTASKVYTAIIAVMEFIVPMVCMGFIYISIALKLWFHRTPPGNVTARHREITVNRQQKTIPMLVTVVVAFFICWAPYHTYTMLYQFFSSEFDLILTHQYTVFYIVEGIAMCNSIVSTLIYFALSTGFRKELISLIERVMSWPYKDRHHSLASCSHSSNAVARNGYPSAGRKITADTLDTKL